MNTGAIPAMSYDDLLRHEIVYKKMNTSDLNGFTIAVAEFNRFRVSKEELECI